MDSLLKPHKSKHHEDRCTWEFEKDEDDPADNDQNTVVDDVFTTSANGTKTLQTAGRVKRGGSCRNKGPPWLPETIACCFCSSQFHCSSKQQWKQLAVILDRVVPHVKGYPNAGSITDEVTN